MTIISVRTERARGGSREFGSVGIQTTMWKTFLFHSKFANQPRGNILIFKTGKDNRNSLSLPGSLFALLLQGPNAI